jgi:hypothetical protein
MGGTGSNHHSRQALLFDVFFDYILSQTGTHEFIIAGNLHIGLLASPTGYLFHVYDFGDVGATMAYINSNFFTHRLSSCFCLRL